MGVIRWRSAGAALVCAGMGAAVTAGPAVAVPLRSPVTAGSTDTGEFPTGTFWIRSPDKGGATECMKRHTTGGRQVGFLRRDTCADSPAHIWTYDPQTRQIRLAANPKICAWGSGGGGASVTAPCNPKEIPAKDAPAHLIKIFAQTSGWGRAWYRDAQQRLYVRKNGDAHRPLYLATTAVTIDLHKMDGVMVTSDRLSEFAGGVVWHLVPPAARQRLS